MNLLKRLFHKELTVSEELEKADRKVWKEKHGKRKFICLYAVVDVDNGFRTVAEGFKTKADAKAFCENCGFNWFINPYFVEL